MKLRREPYLLSERDLLLGQKNIENTPVEQNFEQDYQNNTLKDKMFTKSIFYMFVLSLTLIGIVVVSKEFVNQYSTYKNCQTQSGIWDKENSICGFLVIYGNDFELRKVLID